MILQSLPNMSSPHSDPMVLLIFTIDLLITDLAHEKRFEEPVINTCQEKNYEM